MLRRLGNKTRLLPKLLALFPEQITTFIDMFMGSGVVTSAFYVYDTVIAIVDTETIVE
jgi:site-specific DNA-adenine methylase